MLLKHLYVFIYNLHYQYIAQICSNLRADGYQLSLGQF